MQDALLWSPSRDVPLAPVCGFCWTDLMVLTYERSYLRDGRYTLACLNGWIRGRAA
jgi:hypothetical protein